MSKKTIYRTAFILPYRVIWDIQCNWIALFKRAEIYISCGPCIKGDNKVQVTKDETIIECFSPVSEKWFRDNFSEAREVDILWERS